MRRRSVTDDDDEEHLVASAEEARLLQDAPPPEETSSSLSWRLGISRRMLVTLGLGQLVALLITGTGILSQLLATDYKVNMPTVQSWWNYVLLCGYAVYLGYTNRALFLEGFRVRWWKYFLLTLIDVEANYLMVLAYQYTTITSVMLIDCFAIPTSMTLAFFFLKTKYRWWHLVAVGLCLVGLVLLAVSDLLASEDDPVAPNVLLGDLLCFVGAFLYGIANVSQEVLVKTQGRVECLAFLGVFGTLIGGVQVAILERDSIAAVEWTLQIGLLLAGYALCLFAVYTTIPIVLERSSATLLNLSLLTSDFYALLSGLLIFGFAINPLYYAALVLVVTGLILYERQPPPVSVNLSPKVNGPSSANE